MVIDFQTGIFVVLDEKEGHLIGSGEIGV